MSASERDQELVERCLQREPAAWRHFVDQFLPLFYHTIHHTAAQLSVPLQPEDVEDLAADILACIVDDDCHVLRQFEGRSKLSTYLVVVARRLVIRALRQRITQPKVQSLSDGEGLADMAQDMQRQARRPEIIEDIHQILRQLPRRVRQIVRMHYLEGRTYEEISTALNIPVNSIGPVLTRARRLLLYRLTEREASPSPPPTNQPVAEPGTSQANIPPPSQASEST